MLRYTRALFLGLGCKLFLGEFPAPAWCFGTASSTRAAVGAAAGRLPRAGSLVAERGLLVLGMWAKIWLT